MIRIGLISAASYAPTYSDPTLERTIGSHHGTAFPVCFNGYDPAKKEALWGNATFAASDRRIPGAKVTRVWDPHRDMAEKLAEITGIETVCDTPEECAEQVDACIIVDDGSGAQWEYAVTPLQKGIPTFCDKPLAMTAKQARHIADIAKANNTPFMSASSLRFVPDMVALKQEVRDGVFGDVNLIATACGNSLVYYGVHAIEMAYAIYGGGAVSCMNVGHPGLNVVRVRFESGREVMVFVGMPGHMRAGFGITVYGTKLWKMVEPGLDSLYCYLLEGFMDLVTKGIVHVPIDEEVEVIAALEAGERSLAEGREVGIAEMF
jgi:predicted dehydrogenase